MLGCINTMYQFVFGEIKKETMSNVTYNVYITKEVQNTSQKILEK